MTPFPKFESGMRFRSLTAAVILVFAQPAFAEQYVNLTDNTGSVYSMALGNWSPIASVLKEHKGDVEFAMGFAARERIEYKLHDASAFAKQCYEHQKTKTDPGSVVTGYICGAILAGDEWLRGNISQWASINMQVRDWLYPKIRQLTNKPDAGFRELDVDFEALEKWPSVTYQPITQSTSVPIVWGVPPAFQKVSGSHALPQVEVSINGHRTIMLLDTGSSMSFVNSKDARNLGISNIVSNFERGQSVRGTYLDVAIGLVTEFDIGKAEMHNVPIAIGASPFSILGLTDLSHLGAFRISHDSLEILSATEAEKLSCPRGLAIGSKQQGMDMALIMEIARNGQETIAFVDTGNSAYFSGVERPGMTDPRKLKSDINLSFDGSQTSDYYDTSAEVRFDSKVRKIDIPVRIDRANRYLQSSIVGASALKDISIFVDFNRRRACFHDVR